jgi:hypothetical protein
VYIRVCARTACACLRFGLLSGTLIDFLIKFITRAFGVAVGRGMRRLRLAIVQTALTQLKSWPRAHTMQCYKTGCAMKTAKLSVCQLAQKIGVCSLSIEVLLVAPNPYILYWMLFVPKG